MIKSIRFFRAIDGITGNDIYSKIYLSLIHINTEIDSLQKINKRIL